MRGLNLDKFKKVKSDAKTTTLQHPDGHKILISNSGLSPAMQKQMHALPFAEGGKVGKSTSAYVDTTDSEYAPAKKAESSEHEGDGYSSTPLSAKSASPDPDAKYKRSVADFNSQMGQPVQKAKGGKVAPRKMYAEGDYVSPEGDSPDQILAAASAQSQQAPAAQAQQPQISEQEFAQQHPILDRLGLNGKLLGGPGMQEGVSSDDVASVPASGGMGMSPVQAISPGPDGVQPVIPGTMDQGKDRAPAVAAPDQGPATVPAKPQADQANPVQSAFQSGMNLQMAGLQNQYQAEKQAGADKAAALQETIKQQQAQGDSYDARMSVLQKEREAIINDKIDPNHFWNSKDTTGKITTVLGLLIGGMGGPHGDAASKYIDQAITNDMDAQKTNKSNALSALEHSFGDTQNAAQYHRVLLNDQVSHQMDLAIAKAATPQAKAALQMAQGKLKMDNAIRMTTLGAQMTLNNPKASEQDIAKSLNNLRMTDPAKAKEFETRIVPGVGIADTPVNDKTREAFSAGTTFMQQMDQLEKFRQEHRGALFGAAADEGHRLAELARNSFRIAQGEGVFKAGSQHFNEKLIPDPTDADLFGKNQNAYADMKNQAMNELHNSAVVHGLKPYQGSVLSRGTQGTGGQGGYQPKSFKPVSK